jgi:hypothetical protein
MPDHALLSASSSSRWIACPPSAKLCEGYPDHTSPYAQQGTDAHSLAAYKVLKALGKKADVPAGRLTFFDREMDECTDAYRDFVLEQIGEARKLCYDPLVLVEQRLDFSRWVPEGFGTADACILSDEALFVIDLKYGSGILVDAGWNSQMMCYALGLLESFDGIYDVRSVKLSIFQPRRDHVSTFEISKTDLLSWADTVLAPAAELAFLGEGDFAAGDHCQFCPAKGSCRKRAEFNLEMARYDFEPPPEMTDMEIAAILPRIDDLISWGNDVKDFAVKQALNGRRYEGLELVEGRTKTRYTDDAAVAAAVRAVGKEPYEQRLLGITDMKALLGRKQFNEILGGLTYKPPGKPTLVPESDSRPALDIAKIDFSENSDMEEKCNE